MVIVLYVIKRLSKIRFEKYLLVLVISRLFVIIWIVSLVWWWGVDVRLLWVEE